MLLLIDIGNTNITTGFYEHGFGHVLRFDTDAGGKKPAEILTFLQGVRNRHHIETLEGAVVCSVVPRLTSVFADALKKGFGVKPLIVSHKLKTGLKFRIKRPETLGADRIANAAAARGLYKGHLIVIDFGTATTCCLISEKGEYLGGAIMPGPGISADVLAQKTAKLPRVELRRPAGALGKDTEGNLLSGIIIGHAGAVERMVREFKKGFYSGKVMKVKARVNVIATGGYAGLIVPYIKGINKTNPLLTLEGLRIIYECNK